VGNAHSFPSMQPSLPVSFDDYFPRNQNKNDLGKPRSFLVRVERVELSAGRFDTRLNRAILGYGERNTLFAAVDSDRLRSTTFASSWAPRGQRHRERKRRGLTSRIGVRVHRFKSGWGYFANRQRMLKRWRNRREKSDSICCQLWPSIFRSFHRYGNPLATARTEFTAERNTVD